MPCSCSSDGRRWVAGPEATLSLAGVPVVISSAAHWLRRLLWALILALSLGWLIYLLQTSALKLINRTVEDSVIVMRGIDIPFPAVTVCAEQRYNLKKLSQMLQDGIAVEDWNPSEDITHYQFLQWQELNFDEFVERVAYNWSELVAGCTVFGRPCEELGTVSSAVAHSRGTCHTLRLREPVEGTWMEPQVALNLTLPEWNQSPIKEGWTVYLHQDTLVFNSAAFYTGLFIGIPIRPASETLVRIKRRQNSYINAEHMPCTDNTDWEEINDCMGECMITQDNSATESYKTVSQDDYQGQEQMSSSSSVCRLPWFPNHFGGGPCTTYEDLEEAFGAFPGYTSMTERDGLAAFMTCDCPYFCTDSEYKIETPERFPQSSPAISRDATLKLWINVNQEYNIETWSYDFSQFIADCGGNIGLFLGGSFLSLVEILDVVVFWIAGKAIRARKKTKVTATPWTNLPPGYRGY